MCQNFNSQVKENRQKNKKKYIHSNFTENFIHLQPKTSKKSKTLTNMNKIIRLLDFV